MHDYPRYTGDLDVWINPTMQNAQKMVVVLEKFGSSSFNLIETDFIQAGNVMQIDYPLFRTDILTKMMATTITCARCATVVEPPTHCSEDFGHIPRTVSNILIALQMAGSIMLIIRFW